MKKNDPNQPTRHHIDPRSRQGKGIAIIPRAEHEIYHKLFSNLKPEEIVEFLNTIYWNSMFHITIKRKGK